LIAFATSFKDFHNNDNYTLTMQIVKHKLGKQPLLSTT
jgi:hypothetical protein